MKMKTMTLEDWIGVFRRELSRHPGRLRFESVGSFSMISLSNSAHGETGEITLGFERSRGKRTPAHSRENLLSALHRLPIHTIAVNGKRLVLYGGEKKCVIRLFGCYYLIEDWPWALLWGDEFSCLVFSRSEKLAPAKRLSKAEALAISLKET
jgi:hypothetical protein